MIRTIEQVRGEPLRFIRNRHPIDQLIDRVPWDLMRGTNPILYKDKWISFGNFFLMGLELDFLMLDALTINFVL